MSREDHIEADEASVWNQDTSRPFAKRSIVTFLIIAMIIVGGLYFAGFFSAMMPKQVERSRSTTSIEVNAERVSGVSADGFSGFMKSLFGGMGDGQDGIVTEMVELQQAYDEPAVAKDSYRHSLADIRGSEVYGNDGDLAGEISDIVVDIENGEARAIIVDKEGNAYGRDIVALNFEDVAKQTPGGAVRMIIDDYKLESYQDFEYSRLLQRGYVSLNDLQDGQLIDYQGAIVGQIDAVIYTNAEAQTLYFAPRPTLREQGLPDFYLPFKEAEIIANKDGYDVKLTKSQTEALARVLFPENR